ncbi:MAG: helix-turn-helix domain-containing protein [Mojavia pulchra JT2-VF2]|uniref:Helix-turn-helix domain-containing protein n=1 Tax=Mojavia pulchra JT2-VF2 TaxID=287848 RepID=A0A951UJ33_9NOST|nr:helix-turn-helix domain-containing protein [Mojavia pulchra JT2-VF2]
MAMTPVYLLKTPGNSTIEISQDELRSLLGKIEAELHRSKAYRRALATLQKLLGSSSEQANILFKAVSREAIGLTCQQFMKQHQQDENINPQIDAANISSPIKQEELSTSVQSHIQEPVVNTSDKNLSPSNVVAASVKTNRIESESPAASWMKWLNHHKPQSNIELNKLTPDEERLISLRQIGQQLRQARELKRFSLEQLQAYTRIPIHHIEALENGNLELLPEDVFVRGFIRIMGNTLELNGTALAASLPQDEPVKSVLPSCSQSKKAAGGSGIEIRPMHLYVGYTALVAGAVGGLSLLSQQANANKALHSDVDSHPSSSLSQSTQKTEATTKPGIKSSSNTVIVGPDISPPEAL